MSGLTIVLLPGLDGTGELFDDFVGSLVAKGGSAIEPLVVRYPTDASLGYTELDAWVRAALPQDERYLILGESFSGPLAVTIAATAPRGLVGLVLCCSFVTTPLPSLASLGAVLDLVPFASMPHGLAAPLLLGRFATRTRRRAFVRAISRLSSAAMRRRVREVLAVDVSSSMAEVRVPTLYLRARHDRLVSLRSFERIASIRPDVRVAEFDAPHLLLQSVPDEAADAVLCFAREAVAGRESS